MNEVVKGTTVTAQESLSLFNFEVEKLRSEWLRLAMTSDVPKDDGLEIPVAVSEREAEDDLQG